MDSYRFPVFTRILKINIFLAENRKTGIQPWPRGPAPVARRRRRCRDLDSDVADQY